MTKKLKFHRDENEQLRAYTDPASDKTESHDSGVVPLPHDTEQRAKRLWEEKGRPAGVDADIWFEAERQLLNEAAAGRDRGTAR